MSERFTPDEIDARADALRDNVPFCDDGQSTVGMLRQAAKRERPCEWREDDDGQWHTGCGHLFSSDMDGWVEDTQKFCEYCGGLLQPVAYVEHIYKGEADD